MGSELDDFGKQLDAMVTKDIFLVLLGFLLGIVAGAGFVMVVMV